MNLHCIIEFVQLYYVKFVLDWTLLPKVLKVFFDAIEKAFIFITMQPKEPRKVHNFAPLIATLPLKVLYLLCIWPMARVCKFLLCKMWIWLIVFSWFLKSLESFLKMKMLRKHSYSLPFGPRSQGKFASLIAFLPMKM